MAANAQPKYASNDDLAEVSQELAQAVEQIKVLVKENKSLQLRVKTLEIAFLDAQYTEETDDNEDEDDNEEDEEDEEKGSEYENYNIERKYEEKKELVDMLTKRGVASVTFPIGKGHTRTIRFDPKTSVGRAIDAAEDFLWKPVTKAHYDRLAADGAKMPMTYEQCRDRKVVCGYLLGANVLSTFALDNGKLTLTITK